MNNKVLWIVGGCAVLLLLCCVVVVVGYMLVWPSVQNQILGSLGANVELPLGTVVPPSLGNITPVALPTLGASSSSRASSASSSKASSSSLISGNPFLDALTKAKGATKYRVEFSMVFGGMQSGKYQESPFIAFNGEVDGNNSHIISTGGLMSSLYTGSETGKVEITDVGGKEYLKGATSLMGVIKLDPNTWYIANDTSSNSFASFAKPDEFSSWTGSAKSGDFQKVRSESLDGQGCDVYLYDLKSIQNAALVGLLGSAQDKSGFDSIDVASINLWVCGDGYVHKYVLDYEGHNSKTPTDKAALKMNWHVWDVNNPTINIQTPTGAKPMPTK